jgi:hypothetical protein
MSGLPHPVAGRLSPAPHARPSRLVVVGMTALAGLLTASVVWTLALLVDQLGATP